MTSRSARLCVFAAILASALDALAQNQPPPPLPTNPPQQPAQNAAQPGPTAAPPGPGSEQEVILRLPDADIDTVLTALEIYTGKIILRPQQLQTATYNLKIANPIPKSEAILAIETVLAMNGVSIAPLGERFLKVVNNQNVRHEAPEMISGTTLDLAPSGRAAAKLFQLEFARATEIQSVISGALNPFYGGPVVLPNANALLITDSVSNLQRVERLLAQLDQPITAGMKPRFFPLTEAKASDVVNKLRAIMTGTLQQQIGTATSYSADDRTNQIILVSDPRLHDIFEDLIKRLDTRADPMMRNDVIYLKHAKAKDVVDVISRIINAQTAAQRQNTGSVRPGTLGLPGQPPPQPAAPGQPTPAPAPSIASASNAEGGNEFSAFMTVVSDERSNAVVVSGIGDDIRLVKNLIDKLDIVLSQVRIEVVIAEVTLTDENSSGISQLGLVLEGDKLVGFSGAMAGAGVTGGKIIRPGASGPWDLAAEIAISTTPRKSNSAIISVPSIVTSHGKEAKFFNGETRPVVTGTIQSAAGVSTGLASSSTVTQQQIGTTLTVTPFIGVDDSVQLDLLQSVEDVIDRVQVDNNVQYVIGKRDTKNYVTAKSGQIIVLGGFRKNSDIKSTNRLGPIPILGDIFGSRTKSKGQQEVIFFLRPTVLTNNQAIDNDPALKRIETWPTRDAIKKEFGPNSAPTAPAIPASPAVPNRPATTSPSSVLDKILPK